MKEIQELSMKLVEAVRFHEQVKSIDSFDELITAMNNVEEWNKNHLS